MSCYFYIFVKWRQITSGTNAHNIWPKSPTKDALTPYAEGLACDIFDKNNIALYVVTVHNHGMC